MAALWGAQRKLADLMTPGFGEIKPRDLLEQVDNLAAFFCSKGVLLDANGIGHNGRGQAAAPERNIDASGAFLESGLDQGFQLQIGIKQFIILVRNGELALGSVEYQRGALLFPPLWPLCLHILGTGRLAGEQPESPLFGDTAVANLPVDQNGDEHHREADEP